MSTITLPNIRVGSDLQVRVRLKDGGVAIDWSTLQNIKACIYSDAQRALAGRCAFSIDEEDNTLLVCTYAANKPQYLGVNRIVISAKYMGETKTYDKPAFSFVRWTADQEGEEITIDDPDVDVEITVEDVSSSILQEAVDAAFTAADRANDAAAAAEHMVDIHTGPEGKSAYEVAVDEGFVGTEEEWLASLVGPQGAQGIQGETGEAAGFGSVSAALQEDGGDPSVVVAASGEDTSKNFAFTFKNLKGDKGDKGDQGNTGSSVDYPYELVNNLTTDDATKGLAASQGVALQAEVSQLEAKVIELGDKIPLNLINRGEVSEWDGQTAVTNNFVSLIQGHTYKVTIKFQNSGTCDAADNVKLMTADSLSSVKKIIDIGNRSVTAGDVVSTDLSWSDASVENYRLGVYCGVFSTAIFNGAEISVRDTTAESAKLDASTNSARLVPIAAIGFISTHETDKIAITDTTITIPKNTRIVYGLNGYSYTATQSSATVINRDSNYEQVIVFNIGTKTIVSRMINAVQNNDVILFMVQNNLTGNKRKISLHPSLYTYDGDSPFATDVEISKAMDGVRAENNATYPFKSGGVSSIPASLVTYTAMSGVTLVNGHNYRVKLVADSTFTAPSDFNLKIMTADSDSTLYRVFQMGGTSVSSLSTDFVWEEQTAENYRLGFFGNGAINVGISVYIEDITIDSGIGWDVISRNKHKEASLVSAVSRRGNDAIKVTDKLSLLHFSDVHGNTANIADVVAYMTHYADFLDDTIHTGDSVQFYINNPNPFELVEGAENILNVIGNHEAWLNTSDPDYYATEKQTYDKIFAPSIADWDVVQPTGAAENGYCYYYKDYTTAGFRLIVLDSVHWHYRNGVTDSNPTQKAWFESVLADARTNNLRVVCAMHYPPQNGIVPVANNTGWNAPILSDSGGLVGDGWYAADEIFGCVDAFITAGGKFNGWIMGHTHEDFFGKVLGHTAQPIVVIGTANGSGYIYDKFVSGTVAQDNFNIITFENLNSKDYIKIVKMGGDCDVLMRSKKTICYNVTDGILVSTT